LISKGSGVAPAGFQLFETMYATKVEGPRNLGRHLKRLEASASHFRFPLKIGELRQAIAGHCEAMLRGIPYRLRAAINAAGAIEISANPVANLEQHIVDVLIASDCGFGPQSSQNEFLYHKGTRREEYDRAWRFAEAQGAFDMLFFNERGELTEGGRSNLFLKLDGQWWTPPVSAGLLPGVMRSLILDDPLWMAAERVLVREDLEGCEDLMVCNALRGPVMARVRRVNPIRQSEMFAGR
jgi:para-aminobenzoate synthetase/4-amino-4-deoxychorismate lyase